MMLFRSSPFRRSLKFEYIAVCITACSSPQPLDEKPFCYLTRLCNVDAPACGDVPQPSWPSAARAAMLLRRTVLYRYLAEAGFFGSETRERGYTFGIS
jgi:hypothetical protein